MSNSSVVVDYSTCCHTISDTDTITLTSSASDTITIDNSLWNNSTSTWIGGAGSIGSISISGTGSNCYTIGGAGSTFCYTNGSSSAGIDIGSMFGEDWVTKFPDFQRIQDMCKEYPGLAIAFEKFKTVYKLVKDDYDTPKDQRKRA